MSWPCFKREPLYVYAQNRGLMLQVEREKSQVKRIARQRLFSVTFQERRAGMLSVWWRAGKRAEVRKCEAEARGWGADAGARQRTSCQVEPFLTPLCFLVAWALTSVFSSPLYTPPPPSSTSRGKERRQAREAKGQLIL